MRVSVPASSANLGPGFDCLAVALDLRAEIGQPARQAVGLGGLLLQGLGLGAGVNRRHHL